MPHASPSPPQPAATPPAIAGPDAVPPLSQVAGDAARRWWRLAPDGGTIARRYAMAGAVWSLGAALLALGATLGLAAGHAIPGGAPLGFGRVDAAYVQAMFFGAISLPLAGASLYIGGIGASGAAVRRRARLAWEAWNAGLVAAVAAALAGWPGPSGSPWSLPLPAGAVLWVGAALWAWALGSLATDRQTPAPLAVRLGHMAAVALVVYLGLGVALAPAAPGAGSVFVDGLLVPGLAHLWAIPAGLGVAAAVLPAALGAPLFGRRVLRWGVGAWLVLAPLGLPRDLAPDLAPAWLARLSGASTAGLLAPVALLAIALFGTRLGGRWRARSEDPGAVGRAGATATAELGDEAEGPGATPMAPAADGPAPEGWAAVFVLAGLGLALAAVAVDALTPPGSARLVQLTAWRAGHAWLPPFAGLQILGQGAGLAVLGGLGVRIDAAWARRQAAVAISGALLIAAALAIAGLAQAAAELAGALSTVGLKPAPPSSADLARAEAWLRLPGTVLLGVSAVTWLILALWSRPTAAVAASGPPIAAAPAAGAAVPTLGTVLVVFGAALLITVFVPIALSPAAVPTWNADGGGEASALRAEGKWRYRVERCAACHTQRVRDTLDAARFGPRRPAGDGLPGPVLAGHRRAGPDLTWVGERFDGPDALARTLSAVHGPGGVPAQPWLFETGGPTTAGTAIIGYLDGLRRPGAAATAPSPAPVSVSP